MLNPSAPIFDLPSELQNDVFTIFITDSTQDLENTNIAFENENWLEVRRLLHKIKGASSMIGADALSNLAENLEHDLDQEILPTEPQIKELHNLQSQVTLYLNKVIS